jgi:hypothetical protein
MVRAQFWAQQGTKLGTVIWSGSESLRSLEALRLSEVLGLFTVACDRRFSV